MGTKSSAVWWYGTRRARRTTQWQWVQFKHETNPSTQEIKIQQWVLEVSWSSQFTILSRKSCRVPKTPVETKDVAWLRFFLWCSGPSCCFGMESSPTARSHMGLTCHGAKWLKRKNVPIRRRVETFKRTYKISKYIYIYYIYIYLYIKIYQHISKYRKMYGKSWFCRCDKAPISYKKLFTSPIHKRSTSEVYHEFCDLLDLHLLRFCFMSGSPVHLNV